MKTIKKLMFLLSLGALSLAACNGNTPSGSNSSSEEASTSSYNPEDDGPYTGVGPYVKKVANMPDNFILGMDSSSVLSLEESGVKYYDFDGQEKDLFVILKGQGINTVRIRIWVDPFVSEYSNEKTYKVDAPTYYDGKTYVCKTAITTPEEWNADHWTWKADKRMGYGGGNVNIDRAVEIGKRVTAAGMKVLANFHYSDFWADPGRQLAPKAWQGKTFEEKKTLLYNYTKESMQKFKDNNVDISMVQIGNETTGGLAGETHDEDYKNFSELVTQGTRAVKSVYPEAKTIVHFTNPESGAYGSIASALSSQECEYDIFGTSYYPFFHGTLDNLVAQLNAVTRRSGGKEVMVVETSYAYTDEDTDECGNQFNSEYSGDKFYPITQGGQIANFRNICDAMVNRVRNNLGIGVCYWEGTWISVNQPTWAENKALWDNYGSGWAADWAAEYDPEVAQWGGGGTVVDNQCFFDRNGKPLESLKMFNLLRTGNRTEEWVEGAEDTTVNYMTNEDIKLPEKVRAIYNSDNRWDTAVTWDTSKAYNAKEETINLNGDLNKLKEQGPGTYTVNGTIKVDNKSFDVRCKVKLEVANYVKDPSFEENVNPVTAGSASNVLSNDNWKINDNDTATNKGYLYITNGNDNHPTTGKWDLHGYAKDGNMNYTVTQGNITTSKEVNVKLRFFTTGGADTSGADLGDDKQSSYVCLLEDGNEVGRQSFKITKWGDVHQVDLENLTLKPGKTYTLEIHVEFTAPGIWVDIDDVNIYE